MHILFALDALFGLANSVQSRLVNNGTKRRLGFGSRLPELWDSGLG
jgi:hypothetical protein